MAYLQTIRIELEYKYFTLSISFTSSWANWLVFYEEIPNEIGITYSLHNSYVQHYVTCTITIHSELLGNILVGYYRKKSNVFCWKYWVLAMQYHFKPTRLFQSNAECANFTMDQYVKNFNHFTKNSSQLQNCETIGTTKSFNNFINVIPMLYTNRTDMTK